MDAEGGLWHLAQADSIRHSHNNELGPNDVLHAGAVQLANDCATRIGKDRLDTILLVSQNPVLHICMEGEVCYKEGTIYAELAAGNLVLIPSSSPQTVGCACQRNKASAFSLHFCTSQHKQAGEYEQKR